MCVKGTHFEWLAEDEEEVEKEKWKREVWFVYEHLNVVCTLIVFFKIEYQ